MGWLRRLLGRDAESTSDRGAPAAEAADAGEAAEAGEAREARDRIDAARRRLRDKIPPLEEEPARPRREDETP